MHAFRWLLLAAHAGRAALLLDPSLSSYSDAALLVAAMSQAVHVRERERERRVRARAPPSPLRTAGSALGAVTPSVSASSVAASPLESSARLALLALALYRTHLSLLPLALMRWEHPPPSVTVGASTILFALGAQTLTLTLPIPTRALAARLCVTASTALEPRCADRSYPPLPWRLLLQIVAPRAAALALVVAPSAVAQWHPALRRPLQ